MVAITGDNDRNGKCRHVVAFVCGRHFIGWRRVFYDKLATKRRRAVNVACYQTPMPLCWRLWLPMTSPSLLFNYDNVTKQPCHRAIVRGNVADDRSNDIG